MERYDCIVHGAGMVGLSLATALARGGMTVLVLDARPLQRWRAEAEDLRVSAVTVASERMLRRLGAWSGIAAGRVSPFRGIRVWDGEGNGFLGFDAAEAGEPRLGHIVENGLIQTVLHDCFLQQPTATLLAPASLAGYERSGEELRLRLEDGRRFATPLLVGADGAGSVVRQLAGIPVENGDYGQRGVVAAISPEQPHRELARQRFLAGGPLALLPLSDGRCSIVWSLPEAEAEAVLAVSDAEFCERLTEASAGMLGRVRATGPRAGFPLRRQHARRYVQPGLALVGDAAHVIHPLAGQGANLGWMDAAALAEVVLQARERGRPWGGLAALRRYERWRKGENLLMQRSMDGFHLLFANRQPLLVGLRSLGLNLTDRLTPVKHAFMRRAMGLEGDLPALAGHGGERSAARL